MKTPINRFKFLFITCFCFLFALLSSPPTLFSPLYLVGRNLCIKYFPSHIFTRVIFEQTYKPISFLYCILIEKFGMNPIPHKIVSATFYAVFGASTFLFLKRLTKDENISFISTIISLLLPQFVFYSWPVIDFSNIIGAWCVFIICILFFRENKNFLSKIIILLFSFLSAFSGELSRLFTVPFLILLFLFYPERRGKNLFLIIAVVSFTMISLIIHLLFATSRSRAPIGIDSLLIGSAYYTHFIFNYFLYSYGYIGIFIFQLSFLRFLNGKLKIYVFFIFSFFEILFLFSMPIYPYAELEFNFFFVTPSIPWQFLLMAGGVVLSTIFSFNRTDEKWERFAFTSILLSSLIIIFVTGIFPRIRTDPSARHILVLFPLFSAILINNLFALIKISKGIKITLLIFILLFSFRQFLPLYKLISESRELWSLEYIVRNYFLKEKNDFCVYFLNPQYYIAQAEDVVFPFNMYRKAIAFWWGAPYSLKNIEEICRNRRIFGIFWRFKPHVDPQYEPLGERFYYFLKKVEKEDQFNIALFAKMHIPYPIELEIKLKKYPIVKRIEGKFKSPPLFINEMIFRFLKKIPFIITYSYYFDIYLLSSPSTNSP